MVKRAADAIPNEVLSALREARGETLQDVADAVTELGSEEGTPVQPSASHISRIERGIIPSPTPVYRRLLARHFGVSIAELGFTRRRVVSPSGAVPAARTELAMMEDEPAADEPEPHVAANQQEWRDVRRLLNRHRVGLARLAATLYPPAQRLDSSGLLAGEGWLSPRPLDLDQIGLAYEAAEARPAITGTEPAGARTRPLETVERRYPRYSVAMRDLDRPRLFENRTAWRLVDAQMGGPARLAFADTTYFDAVDVCEAVAHETAAAAVAGDTLRSPSWRELPMRLDVGDPFDGRRRTLLPSIDTLTIRRDRDGASFVLHNREAAKVVIAGGMLHIMPAGVFQPSSLRAQAQGIDFDLWRNIQREYSEEFLGNAEHGGDGDVIDYDAEPFAEFDAARAAGSLRVSCFGLALDALTLWGEILTVAVFDAPVYDRLFAAMVQRNDEGAVVRTGRVHPTSAIPFTEHVVDELLDGGRMAPAAAGCLQLAWEHRRVLLDG